ncbi:MAG: nucleoside triphosphate pyrophosphohydrolase [Dehalococcoidales bacterium]|nr:nucleoside triphosphate pyrophosphohydrolase [Dehalococcoidales bacterium]
MAAFSDLGKFETLVDIIARLRAPEGCPWDRKQTHRSLREYVLEESYEVLQALDEEDMGKLSGELGDLLLQIVLQTQIAEENNEFKLKDVITKINTKLIQRHPHIFGDVKVKTAEEVSRNWEQIKKAERGENASVLSTVPKQMPSLAYSQEIQRRVAGVGFDWENDDGVVEKLVEEVREYQATTSPEQREEEFGDILFTLANIARRKDIDLENALRQANQKFFRRFTKMEELCRQRKLSFEKLSFERQNALWEEAKKLTE